MLRPKVETLEEQLQAELVDARRVSAGDLPVCTGGDGRDRVGEIGVVEGVECLGPELGVDALPAEQILEDRGVHVGVAWTAKAVATCIAEGASRSGNEGGSVEIFFDTAHSRKAADESPGQSIFSRRIAPPGNLSFNAEVSKRDLRRALQFGSR